MLSTPIRRAVEQGEYHIFDPLLHRMVVEGDPVWPFWTRVLAIGESLRYPVIDRGFMYWDKRTGDLAVAYSQELEYPDPDSPCACTILKSWTDQAPDLSPFSAFLAARLFEPQSQSAQQTLDRMREAQRAKEQKKQDNWHAREDVLNHYRRAGNERMANLLRRVIWDSDEDYT